MNAISTVVRIDESLEARFEGRAKGLGIASTRFVFEVQSFLNDLGSSVITHNTKWGSLNTLWIELNPKSCDKNSLRKWVLKYMPMKFDKDSQSFVRDNNKKWSRDLLQEGMLNPFHAVTEGKEKDTKDYSKLAEFLALKKIIEKRAAKAYSAGDNEAGDVLTNMALILDLG